MEVILYGKKYKTDIYRLDLSYKKLTYICPNICKLINLQKLILYCNQIITICPEIGQLINLQIFGHIYVNFLDDKSSIYISVLYF